MRMPSSFQEPLASFPAPRSVHTPNQRHALLAMPVSAVRAVPLFFDAARAQELAETVQGQCTNLAW